MSIESDIFEARADRSEALRVYRAKLAEFAKDMTELRDRGSLVRLVGYPTTTTIEFANDSGGTNVIVVACAPLIDVEGEGPKPWDISGMLADVSLKKDDVDLGIRPVGGDRIITFPLCGLSQLGVEGEIE